MATVEGTTATDIGVRRTSWGAILVGAAVAMALMVLFTTLGLAIGAAAIDPLHEENPLSGIGVGSGIYIVATQLISLAVGGFTAARLAGVPRPMSSLLHGAAVWALATLLLAWASIAGGGALFGAGSTILSNAARGAADVVQALAPDDFSFPDVPEIAGGISIEDLPDEVRQTLETNGITLPQLRDAAREAYRDVVSPQEAQRAVNVLQGALAEAIRSPDEAGNVIDTALENLVGGPDAVFSAEDREEALMVLERRLGVTPAEAEQVAQAIGTRIDEAIAGLRETLDQIRRQALEAAQAATSAVANTAMWLTIASVLGLAAALGGAFGGTPGGRLGEARRGIA